MSNAVPPTSPERRKVTWHAYAPRYRRVRLFSPWLTGGFGIAILMALAMAYPYWLLEQCLVASNRSQQPDQLTIGYLKAFLATTHPGSYELRANLVRQLIRLGAYGQARSISSPLHRVPDPRRRMEVAWMGLEMLEQEAFSVANDPDERTRRVARAGQQIRWLLQQPQPPERVVELGHAALALGDDATAMAVYEQIARTGPDMSASLYDQVGREALALHGYATSADLYFHAMRRSRALEDQRTYYMRALDNLRAGNLFDAALAAADANLGTLAQDSQTLLYLTRMAQSMNRPAAAQRYAQQLLKLSFLRGAPSRPGLQMAKLSVSSYPLGRTSRVNWFRAGLRRVSDDHVTAATEPPDKASWPFDEEAYQLSFEVFLANSNLEDARLLAESAVRRQPGNAIWRKRLAQVNEWSGRPQEALPQ